MIRFWNAFVKITGWPTQFFCFRTKVYYENASTCSRRIKGPAIIISNHTSVFDYAVYLFVFFSRTLRFQMAEVLYKKRLLGWFLRRMGGIYVDREGFDFGFVTRSEEILRRGGVVGIFPESRIPKPGEERPLEFKTSAAYIALRAGVPVIPAVTDGSYFKKSRARVMIGEPINVGDLSDPSLKEKEDLKNVSAKLRERIIELEKKLYEEGEKSKS
ncbi:MAG: 1-acyl-sn-glycerol-3-phosphate acyltransferase [Clostridia bacterium]|nr:1-acyl-sn-glycerol-3-phosphate acyltransferase [Clostridia bacterium]MBR7033779.1 1-acyl-sn-glycerol-3-phosphate acyltransferase [Clostridia bacterium]